jgi:colanic acid/amylovoran biosynthesis glycosyltransferase
MNFFLTPRKTESEGDRVKKIAFLIPEFPGQTHNFFWREIDALKEMGAEVALFSTRRPVSGIQSTSWGEAAMLETTYLFPMSLSVMAGVVRDLILSPTRFFRCAGMFLSSVRDLKKGESPLRLLAIVLVGVGLGRLCVNRGLHHLHVHSCADAANVALFAHAAFGLEYSMTLHNPLSIWGGNQKNKWRYAKFGIVIADWILQDIRSRLGAELPSAMRIAPMGVNVDVFRRKKPYRPMDEGVLKVFSCARLNAAKGFEVLLEAIDRLKQQGHRVSLTIAGEDDAGGVGYRMVLEAIISSKGLESEVHLMGAVPEERVRAELERAHVFVLASFEEPLGVAIMEAMAMEVPVIATNAGGVPSIVTEGVDGLLVPPSDAIALAVALTRVGEAPGLAVGLSLRGRMRVMDAFHHRLSAKAIIDQV